MAEPMLSVCWKDHTRELATEYKSLLENKFLVDCTLSAEGRSLKAHRLVLSACSLYFRMLFEEETGKHPFVILLDASFETLRAVINFVYQGETQIPYGNLKAFLMLAKSLQIKGLNGFSQDKKNKNLFRNTAGNVSRGPPKDNEDTYGVQCISARQKDSPEDSSQHHPDHSDHFLDSVHTNSSVPFEAFNASSVKVQAESVITPHIPVRDDEMSEDTEKQETLFTVLSGTLNKRLDNAKRNEAHTANFINEFDGGTPFLLAGHSSCGGPSHGNMESSMITHLHQQLMQSNKVVSGGDVAEKCQPLQPVILVPKCERLDNVDEENLNEFDVPGSDINGIYAETEHLCGEQYLDKFSSADGLPLELATQRRSLAGQQSESSPPHTELQSHEGRHAHPGGQTLPSDEGGTAPAHSPNASTHEPRRAGKRTFRCEVCQKAFPFLSHLARHVPMHTGERPFHCAVCSMTFTQKSHVVIHMKKHMGEQTGKQRHDGTRKFRCEMCEKAFPSPSLLARHERVHTGERPYRCEVCCKTFTQKGNVVTHMQKHMRKQTGEQTLPSDEGGTASAHSLNASTHKPRGSGKRSFLCEVCGKAFPFPSRLARHVRVHTGEQPYRCEVCKKSFSTLYRRNVHMRIHTGERPYGCETCGRTYTQKGHLNNHQRAHKNERPFR